MKNKKVWAIIKRHKYDGIHEIVGVFADRPKARRICSKLDKEQKQEDLDLFGDKYSDDRYQWYELTKYVLNQLITY